MLRRSATVYVIDLRTMSNASPTEQCELALSTPAGRITTSVEVPTSFVPITAIVPLGRQLAAQAQQLEVDLVERAGQKVSCREGCAACCRMLVPLSAPEVFHVQDAVRRLPDEIRARVHERLAQTKTALTGAGLVTKLRALGEADRPMTDAELEPINHAYYALRLPCPLLEAEHCVIYDDRPSACRELLVTSPPELCNDMEHNAVQPIPAGLRLSTALGLLWAGMRQEAPRLIPLPIALDWAAQHDAERSSGGKGTAVLEIFLDKLWRLLSQEFAARPSADPGAAPPPASPTPST